MSRYKGFHSSYAAFIRQIRENLREGRYGQDRDCFGILKELVQNADDAAARRVQIGVSAPVLDARHPLLRAPGLFAINDGVFTPSDAEAIRCFSLNAKAADRSAIGKFGLGLKSVFHLGEAFFFLADGGGDYRVADVLNPWSSATGTGLHPDWDEFADDDRDRLYERLSPLIPSGSHFCIWVPLRTRDAVGGVDPLVPFYPGDQDYPLPLDRAQGSGLGSLLPLLAHVEEIQGWRFGDSSPVMAFQTRLEPGARRRSRSLAPGRAEGLFGAISVAGEADSNAILLRFVGHETKSADPELAELQAHASWPRDFALDLTTGVEASVAEKADPHGAVALITRELPPGTRGRLKIQWSVFLPLSEPVEYELGDVPLEVELFLHGYFFVDAGRNRIEGIEHNPPANGAIESPVSLRRAWNHRLARQATLPALPEVLSRLAGDDAPGLNEDALGAITQAIARSELFARFRTAVCRDFNWARVLRPDGTFSWTRFSSSEPIYELPTSDPPEMMALVLPALLSLAQGLKIARDGDPRLLLAVPVHPWPHHLLQQLVAGAGREELLGDERRLAYLADFLDQCGGPEAWSSLADHLLHVLRAGLRELGLAKLRGGCTVLRSFIDRLPTRRILPLDLSSTPGAERLFSEVLDIEMPALIVPAELGPTGPGPRATLATRDVTRLLRHLGTRLEGATVADDRLMIAELAGQLIAAADDSTAVRATCGDLAVFWGTDCRERKATRFTLRQLDAARGRGLLFVQPPSRAYSLQEALDEERLLLVSNKLYLSLYPVQNAPSCRESDVLKVLSQPRPPTLRAPADRVKLLDALLSYQGGRSDPNYKRSVRYLLHGQPENYATPDPLLVADAGSHPVWHRVVDAALRHLGATWRLVDRSLARRLSQEHREEFDVQVIGPTNAIELMRMAGPGALEELAPSDEEYAALLRSIDDDALCRSLPIHLGVDGRHGSIDARTYLATEAEIPEGLARSVRLLVPSGHEAARNRQKELAPAFNATDLLRLVLEQDQPGPYADAILQALGRLGRLPGPIAERLAAACWLPTREGGFAKPCDVIRLPEIAPDVVRLTAEYPGVFLEPDGVAAWVREHASYPLVERELFPRRDLALSMLGTLLLEDERNYVGEIETELFEDWLDGMQGIPASVFPNVPLLRETARHYQDGARRVFDELRRPIPDERVEAILKHLETAMRGAPSKNRKDKLVRIYCTYLHIGISRETFFLKLARRELPNRAGGWRPSAELCWDDDGVSEEHLLEPGVEQVLRAAAPDLQEWDGLPRLGPKTAAGDPNGSDLEAQMAATSSVLADYFAPWQDVIPSEQVGGFLALLGEDPGVRKLAQEFLGKNRTIEETRLKFGLPEMIAGRGIEDGPTMIRKQRVIVEVCRGPTVRLRNILDQPFEVLKREVPPVLFLGYGQPNNPFPHRVVDGVRVLWFRLNDLDPGRVDPGTLSRLLRDSAVRFIGAAYNSYEHQTRFASAWDELSESDQLDIRIAQSRVVENGLLILDQLGLRSSPRIAAAIDRWDAAQRLDAEQRLGPAAGQRVSSRSATRELEQAKADLRSILEDRDEVETHQRILEAVRSRVGQHFQYEPGSVPFELFQNADDSSVELIECFPVSDAARREASRFLVMREAALVTFAHFGRRINQYPAAGSATARTRGFDDDLWKMLVLSLSNKPAAADGCVAPVTGKFGLGFKSVFLVSDRPRILSGRLAFEVTGGVYPRRLVATERHTLDQTRARLREGQRQATVLELPLREGGDRDFLGRFLELAHFQVAFARQIRRLGFEPGGEEVRWDPAPVSGVPGCLLGALAPLSYARERGHDPSRAILFQGPAGSLLFRLGPRGLGRFPADVPTIWVTTPTRERLPLGFLLNGPFAVDIGRAQIARDPAANRPAADDLGRQFGNQLTTLYDASHRSWDTVRTALGLASDTTFEEFWDSFWGLLAEDLAGVATRSEPVDLLVEEVLWGGGDRGVLGLCQSRAAIPTRLAGPYAVLVTLAQIRFAVRGALAHAEGLFAEVLCWPSFQTNAPAGTVVRDRDVASPLRRLHAEGCARVRPLTLSQAVAWELEPLRLVNPQHATRLGSTLTRARLEQIGDHAERTEVRRQLDEVQFRATDGHYHPARELLLGHRPELPGIERQDDEQRRARFAPLSRVLAPDYDAAGVEFFLACRERLEAPTRLLAEWVLLAEDDVRRRSALEYLADGDLGREIQQELCGRGLAGSWLERLRESPAFLDLDGLQQARLGLLLPRDAIIILPPPTHDGDARRRSREPEEILADIFQWWSRERGRALAEYERRTYPDGRRPAVLEEGFEGRKGWVTLLLLGLTHTMGRTRAEAHRNFLADCDHRGWLNMFAASERSPERWMQFVDAYLEAQVDDSRFLQWMKQFVGIYQLSRQLDDYADIFRAIDRIGRPFSLDEVTVPNTSVLLQGSGIEAPPLTRVLGIGACFVMRELIRLGVITTAHARPHCYPPVKRVRDLCMQLGCPSLETEYRRWEMSREIHTFLVQCLGPERASFRGDFDIPLQVIAEDERLQERFLGTILPDDDEEEEEAEQVA